MISGPGPNGSPWQKAVWEHWKREAELEKEHRDIVSQLDAISGYDPVTGKGIPIIQSPEKRKAMGHRLWTVAEDLSRVTGEPGQANLTKQLDAAVLAEQKRIRREYIQAEAKRRAKAEAVEAEIEAAKAGYSKGIKGR